MYLQFEVADFSFIFHSKLKLLAILKILRIINVPLISSAVPNFRVIQHKHDTVLMVCCNLDLKHTAIQFKMNSFHYFLRTVVVTHTYKSVKYIEMMVRPDLILINDIRGIFFQKFNQFL